MLLRRLLRVRLLTPVLPVLAEMMGTFAIIFVGTGSIILHARYPQAVPAYIIPIAWGLTIALMIMALGHISGAHFNPAVTLAFAAAKRWPTLQVACYWAGQLSGGLAAMAVLEALKKL